MTSPPTLRTAVLAALLAPLLVASPAYCQTDQATSLLEALSLVSGGTLVAPNVAPEVTQDGDRFQVRIPLPKLTSPPNASIDVTATPLASGVWDITGMTFPQEGTLVTQGAPNIPPKSLRFSIGQQATRAKIDPTLAVPSPYAMALSDIALHVDGITPADLTVGQLTSEGTILGDADHRMSLKSRSLAENWHLTSSSKTGAPFALSLKSLDVHYDLDSLDRTQAQRLAQAIRGISANRPPPVPGQSPAPPVPGQLPAPPVPGQSPAMSPAMREQLRTLIDASPGLLSGFSIEEQFRSLHFETSGGSGDIGNMRFDAAAASNNNRLAGHYDLGVTEIVFPSVPAAYAPRRISIKTVFSGIAAEPLRHLLREATEPGADPAALQAQAVALLNEPGARAGIESLSIESGPLVLQGSAQVRPMPDGSAALNIHLMARGIDAMLALVQSDPKVQQIMPILFIAKGMGKKDGDGIVWDIDLANGIFTVNGVPMGQGGGAPPAPRPPVSR